MAPTGSFALRAAAAALLAGSAAAENTVIWGPTCNGASSGSLTMTGNICTSKWGTCLGAVRASQPAKGQIRLTIYKDANCASVQSTWDMAPGEAQKFVQGGCAVAKGSGTTYAFRLTPSGCPSADDCGTCLKSEMKGAFSACRDAGKDSAKDVLKDNLKSLAPQLMTSISGALAEVTANAASVGKDVAIAGCAECINACVDKLKSSECDSCGSLPFIAGSLLGSVLDAQARCTAVLNVKMGSGSGTPTPSPSPSPSPSDPTPTPTPSPTPDHAWTQADVDKAATAPVSCQDAHCDETVSGNKGDNYRGCQVWTRSGYYCQPWAKAGEPYSGQDQNYCRNLASEQDTIWCYVDAQQSNGNFWELCDPCQAPPPTASGARHLGLATAAAAGLVANVVRLAV